MDVLNGQEFEVHHGDCVHFINKMPDSCVDMSVFSPPFPALYAYTSEACDIGNSEELRHEAKIHLSYFYRQLARVVKPGRVVMVHVMQIPRMKRSGEVGLHDFRGMNIRIGERAGLVFEYDWSVRKNPQAQAIRTKSRELQFVGLERDRAKARGTLNDYLIKFRTPGENETPIQSQDGWNQTKWRNSWIDWAEGTWADIRETDTLNVRGTKSEDDVKHICPLQLGVIERLIRLYSNEGEIVFSPFTGIGSEGYVSMLLKRRFLGCELKAEYHKKALENIESAISKREKSESMPLFT